MTHTLLIWENIPQAIGFYLIPDEVMKPKWLEKLTAAHGYYINGGDNSDEAEEALDWVNKATSPDNYADEDVDNVLHQFKTEMNQPLINAHITRVFYMGFYM